MTDLNTIARAVDAARDVELTDLRARNALLEEIADQSVTELAGSQAFVKLHQDTVAERDQLKAALEMEHEARLHVVSQLEQARKDREIYLDAVNALDAAISEGMVSEHHDHVYRSEIYNRRVVPTLTLALDTARQAEKEKI